MKEIENYNIYVFLSHHKQEITKLVCVVNYI